MSLRGLLRQGDAPRKAGRPGSRISWRGELQISKWAHGGRLASETSELQTAQISDWFWKDFALKFQKDLKKLGEVVLANSSYGGASSKESACQCRRHKRHGFDPWVERSPAGGHGNSMAFHYSDLENPTDRGAWQATVQRVAKSQT